MFLKVRAILVLAVGTAFGLSLSVGGDVLAEREARQVPAAQSLPGESLPGESLELLRRVVERVTAEYVDPIDQRRVIENAIRGILDDLDPHSRYLPPSDYEDVRISTTGNYSGIGLDVSIENGKLTVVSPLDGAPAAGAGILPGDIVISVDDVTVGDDTVDEAVGRMRGEPGTRVTLGVLRSGHDEPLSFELTRADIQVRTVTAELLADAFAYVRLTAFSKKTAGDLELAAARLTNAASKGLRGMVLDLRNNPGGVLDAAIEVADLFLDDGLIVRGTGRARQARFERHASTGDLLEQVPLVVLVNGGSASASEIVAGAVKDHGRARLVGTRTYGKGSVQTVMPLGGGSAIKLTTSHYLTPSGQSINGIGIDPDLVVRNADAKRQYRGPDGATTVAEDEQLREALRLLGHDVVPQQLVAEQL